MKAKDVLSVLRITRPTLTRYVKDEIIKVNVLPNGRYDYDEESVYSFLNKDVSSEMVKKFELFSGRKNDKFQNISTVMDKNNVPYVTKKCKHCHKR